MIPEFEDRVVRSHEAHGWSKALHSPATSSGALVREIRASLGIGTLIVVLSQDKGFGLRFILDAILLSQERVSRRCASQLSSPFSAFHATAHLACSFLG